MAIFTSNSEAETVALGELWGTEARAGFVFGLIGPLGAGKTKLVQGIAKGLGIKSRVRSPTFTLVHEYRDGRIPLFHLDLYRLGTSRDFENAGLVEYMFNPEGITVVEWFDRWPREISIMDSMPRGALFRRVVIEVLGENSRRVVYEDTCA
ncbi:MAG: tRNA (adenosine(37)-N6)-threonylcarbamoyltransferase complex ATPase subunit type 1 TsaE [Verrucomicrobiae bacterium]|nr:tRNA (adenosine(37)-N6)-threonylcarbamoyltransferase complex ATPase subunit type 1 TsaE [Verrucomicrobiae bacterium]